MRRFIVAAFLLGALACAYEAPQAPTPPPEPTPTPTPTLPPATPAALNATLIGGTGMSGRPVMFTATVSNGAPPFQYAVSFGDGASASRTTSERVIEVEHVYGRSGLYATRLVVTDAGGQSGQNSGEASIADPPAPPAPTPPPPPLPPTYVVSVVASPSTVVAGEPTTLTATATPANGAPPATTFEWDCDSDGTIDEATAAPTKACTYTTVGEKTATVVARSIVTGTGTVGITVQAAHDLLVAITADDLTPAIGQNVTFTATVSSLGPIPASLEWSFDNTNDGSYESIGTGSNPRTHAVAYGAAGVKEIKVRVRDVATAREATSVLEFTVQ